MNYIHIKIGIFRYLLHIIYTIAQWMYLIMIYKYRYKHFILDTVVKYNNFIKKTIINVKTRLSIDWCRHDNHYNNSNLWPYNQEPTNTLKCLELDWQSDPGADYWIWHALGWSTPGCNHNHRQHGPCICWRII